MPTYTPEDVQREESRPETTQPPEPKRSALPMVLGVILLLAIGGGTYWWMHRFEISTDDAQVDGHIGPIAARISGSVEQVLVNNNETVKAGQVLVKIDPRDLQAKVDQAKAALALAQAQALAAGAGVPLVTETTASSTTEAEAQIATAEAEVRRAQIAAAQAETSEISNAKSNYEEAKANAERAQADLNRMKPLADKAEISRLQFDSYVAASRVAEAKMRAMQDKISSAEQAAANARQGVKTAQSRVDQAKAALTMARAGQGQVKVTRAQASSASAAVEQARTNLAAAELNLSYTTVTAPIDGVVTRKSVEPGQILQPGQSLMTVIPLHDVWVTANFKETQLAKVRPGMKAEIKVDMYGATVEGRVDSIAGATGARLSLLPPENATGNFVKVVQRIPVKIVFDKLPGNVVLRPGMNVDATIVTNSATQ